MEEEIIILYNNGEYDTHEGDLESAISYLKDGVNYKNYGRNGARIFKGKKIYSINDEIVEKTYA